MYFTSIREYLDLKKPKYFRWHVAGDIPTIDYFRMMKHVAVDYPKTKFLCYTKQYELVDNILPSNFSLVVSAWPGLDFPNLKLPVAWMQDGTETRITKNAINCPGKCDVCYKCWNLNKLKRDVVFNVH